MNVNLKTSRWFDWFFGGLHFHIEHHIFAKMPRHNLRLITYDIKKLTKDQGIDYEFEWVWYVLANICKHLKKVSKTWVLNYEKQNRDIGFMKTN